VEINLLRPPIPRHLEAEARSYASGRPIFPASIFCLAARLSRPMRVTLSALVLAAVLPLAPRPAAARCAADFVQTWPETGARGVPTNASIVVVFGDTTGVDGPLPAFRLTSPRDRAVPLRVVLDQRGGDGFRPQRTVVLTPERALRADAPYRLAGRFGSRGWVRLAFRTGAGPDAAAPRLVAARAGAFGSVEYGCGPGHQVPVTLEGAADDGALPFVRLRLAASAADLAAGRLLGDVLVPRDADGVARFGHGMCFGNWPLEPGDRFVARVSVVDAALQESAPLPPVTIEAR
jgi:hypothetical protein